MSVLFFHIDKTCRRNQLFNITRIPIMVDEKLIGQFVANSYLAQQQFAMCLKAYYCPAKRKRKDSL